MSGLYVCRVYALLFMISLFTIIFFWCDSKCLFLLLGFEQLSLYIGSIRTIFFILLVHFVHLKSSSVSSISFYLVFHPLILIAVGVRSIDRLFSCFVVWKNRFSWQLHLKRAWLKRNLVLSIMKNAEIHIQVALKPRPIFLENAYFTVGVKGFHFS